MTRRRVALLMTDVQGSTRLWELAPGAMSAAMARHDDIARDVLGSALVKPRGEGDSLFAVFDASDDALRASVELLRALGREAWPEPVVIRTRAAVHCGVAEARDADFYGPEVNRCARLRGLAHGGQILLSSGVTRDVEGRLPSGCALRSLGAHRLKDIERPEQVSQLVHPDLPAEFPPLASAEGFAGNLADPITTLIGREHELDEVADLLTSERLVTLEGPGGAGKTTLALAAGRRLRGQLAGGAWFADLSNVASGQVSLAVADALGLEQDPGRSLVETITAQLAGFPTLLIVDNCEHVLDEAATTVGQLMAASPQLRILATSRECLGLPAERRVRVGPLGLPPVRATDEEILAAPSVQMLVDRMARAGAQPPGRGEASLLAELCRRLDALPLALELAAPRAAVLGPAAMLESVTEHLDSLSARRPASERQRTLRALLDWSHDRLSHEEQTTLRRLGVFTGHFGLDEAREVCGFESVAREAVAAHVESLANKSLLVTDSPGSFHMLETIREYARGRLRDAEEQELVADRHARCYRDLCFRDVPLGPDREALIARIRANMDDLRGALARFEATGRAAVALEMITRTRELWHFWGHNREARRLIERLLPEAEAASTGVRARALVHLARCLAEAGEADAAGRHAREALHLALSTDDAELESSVRSHAGAVAGVTGDLEWLEELATGHLSAAQRAGTAEAHLEAHVSVGVACFFGGRLQDAVTHYRAAEAVARTVRSDVDLTLALYNRAEVADLLGQHEAAAVLYGEALEGLLQSPSPNLQSLLGRRLAVNRLALGRPSEAWLDVRHAARAESELLRPAFAAPIMAGAACAMAGLGDHQAAALMLGAGRCLAPDFGEALADERDRFEGLAGRLRETLGTGLSETLMATGATWSVAEALGFLLTLPERVA